MDIKHLDYIEGLERSGYGLVRSTPKFSLKAELGRAAAMVAFIIVLTVFCIITQ